MIVGDSGSLWQERMVEKTEDTTLAFIMCYYTPTKSLIPSAIRFLNDNDNYAFFNLSVVHPRPVDVNLNLNPIPALEPSTCQV